MQKLWFWDTTGPWAKVANEGPTVLEPKFLNLTRNFLSHIKLGGVGNDADGRKRTRAMVGTRLQWRKNPSQKSVEIQDILKNILDFYFFILKLQWN